MESPFGSLNYSATNLSSKRKSCGSIVIGNIMPLQHTVQFMPVLEERLHHAPEPEAFHALEVGNFFLEGKTHGFSFTHDMVHDA